MPHHEFPALSLIPVWSTQVPPSAQDRSSFPIWAEQFDRATIAGVNDNKHGLLSSGVKLNAEMMKFFGFPDVAVDRAALGIPALLDRELRRFVLPSFHTKSVLDQAEHVGLLIQEEQAESGREELNLDYTPHLVTPMLFISKTKFNGTVKERLADDHSRTGLNGATIKIITIMPTPFSAIPLMRPNAVLGSTDGKQAFRHHALMARIADLWGSALPPTMAPFRRRFLDFGQLNGPALALDFVNSISLIEADLMGFDSITMIDDAFFAAMSFPELARLINDHIWFCNLIGYENNLDKIEVGVQIPWYGVLYDCICDSKEDWLKARQAGAAPSTRRSGAIKVRPERLSHYLAQCQLLLDTGINTGFVGMWADLEQLLGRLNFAAPEIWGAKCYLFEAYEALYGTGSIATQHDDDFDFSKPELSIFVDDAGRPTTKRATRLRAALPVLGRRIGGPVPRTRDPALPIALTEGLRMVLRWWLDNARERSSIGLPLHLDQPLSGPWRGQTIDTIHQVHQNLSITSEGIACLIGDAARDDTSAAGGYFFRHEYRRVDYTEPDRQALSINHMEMDTQLRAVLEFLQTAAFTTKEDRVILYCDNLGDVYILKSGSSSSPELRRLVRLVYAHSWQLRIEFWPIWIKSDDNPVADGISRVKVPTQTSDHRFRFLLELCLEFNLPPHTLDGWANINGSNALCELFCSELNSFFDHDLASHNVWVNMDFSSIASALRHLTDCIIRNKSSFPTTATVLVPNRGPKDTSWRYLLQRPGARGRLLHSFPAYSKPLFDSAATHASSSAPFIQDHPRVLLDSGTPFVVEVWRFD